MTPYYDEGGVTLFLGDLRDIVPELGRFDLAVCDPPYGIGETGKVAGATRGGKTSAVMHNAGAYVPCMTYDGHDYDAEKWTTEHFAVLRKATTEQIIWGGNYYADILPPSASWLVWDKENGGNDFADVELAWTSHKTAARLFQYRWNGMLQAPGYPREPRVYPGQKPVALMRWVLTLFAKPGFRVLDPCCGSGPVLRACKDLGYSAVGIDISEQALELTAKRLQQEVLVL